MNFRDSSRNWLINHPRMNPYNFSLVGTFRTLTIPLRTLPDFLIIGFHKTATTSLYDYLIQHPNIGSATHKELHYFDTYFWRKLSKHPNLSLKWIKSFSNQNWDYHKLS